MARLAALVLSEAERSELTSLAARRKMAQALALRARIVLGWAAGAENKDVAAHLRVDASTVGKWRRRFVERGMDGLHDEPRSGAPRMIDDTRIEAVIVQTLESTPPGATHWSSRGRRGVHRSVADLQAAITAFIEHHNADPTPFRWTKSADDILASIERFCLRNTKAVNLANF